MEDTSSDFQSSSSTTDCITSQEQNTPINLVKRGSGIYFEWTKLNSFAALQVVQGGLLPTSNNTARAVKKKLGGDWLVIVYPNGKPVDFNMTSVQGNDYLYFIVNENAFQGCRLG